jgi:ABC-type transport system substrate-binding protein
MSRLSRRQVLAGMGATVAVNALSAPAVHAQKRGGTLRFVAEADLKIVDPVWTTAYITRNHSYLVYDTLFGMDEHHQVKPQMVDRTTVSANGMKYTFTLRDGLRWHDGQPVHPEDCVESLKRWGKRDRFGQLLDPGDPDEASRRAFSFDADPPGKSGRTRHHSLSGNKLRISASRSRGLYGLAM